MNEYSSYYVDGAAQALIDKFLGQTTVNPNVWESWSFFEWQKGYDNETLQNALREKNGR